MISHKRNKSRGSISILAHDIVRSVGRITNSNEDHLGRTSVTQAQTDSELEDSFSAHRRRQRPTSWLSLPSLSTFKKNNVSHSSIPQEFSNSDLDARAVSSPVLTSTTNFEIAQSQGVHHDTVVEGAGIFPPIKPKVTSSLGATKLAELIQEAEHDAAESNSTASVNSSWNVNSGPLSRLRKNLAIKFAVLTRDEKFERLKDEKPSPPFEKKLARRKAEALNLAREKIRELSGNGNIRRKPLLTPNTSTELLHDQEELNTGDRRDALSSRTDDQNSDLHLSLSDLEDSFATAIDKLEFESGTRLDAKSTSANSRDRSRSIEIMGAAATTLRDSMEWRKSKLPAATLLPNGRQSCIAEKPRSSPC